MKRSRLSGPLAAGTALAGAIAFLATVSPGQSQILSPDTGGTRIGEREVPASEEEAAGRLKEMLPLWSAASGRYERYALQFFCTETHRVIDYSRSAGEARGEKETPYGYLLTLDPKNSSYEVIRQVLDANGQPTGHEKSIELHAPEPYAWTFLFLPTVASTLRFHYLGREIQNFRLTHVISFEGSAPRVDGRDPREWTGTIWVEENTGNLVRIEARPCFQYDRMLALWREFQQAFTFPLGIRSKARPHGYVLALLCDYEHDGLLFPSRLDLSDFVWVDTNHEAMDTRLVLTYDGYHFFYVGATEIVRPPQDGRR